MIEEGVAAIILVLSSPDEDPTAQAFDGTLEPTRSRPFGFMKLTLRAWSEFLY